MPSFADMALASKFQKRGLRNRVVRQASTAALDRGVDLWESFSDKKGRARTGKGQPGEVC